MHAIQPEQHWTADDYLVYEETADERHEFLDGQIYAMAGATERHNQITMAIAAHLYMALIDKPCQVFQGDMRVQTANSYFYPDIAVVCGEAEYTTEKRTTLTNLTVVMEVVSPSSEDIDRGRKFRDYRALESVQDYLIFAQDRIHVEHYSRQAPDIWKIQDIADKNATLNLNSIVCTLALADVYRRVTFEE